MAYHYGIFETPLAAIAHVLAQREISVRKYPSIAAHMTESAITDIRAVLDQCAAEASAIAAKADPEFAARMGKFVPSQPARVGEMV